MGFIIISTSLPPLLIFAVISVLFCGMVSTVNLGYTCFYGEMMTASISHNRTLEYCEAVMIPPVMRRGTHMLAFKDGKWWECICSADTGLACCEYRRPRPGR